MENEGLTIRNAQVEDVDLVYDWSNEDLVRAQSFNSNSIPYASHCEWFDGKMKSKNSFIYILEFNAIPAAIVRFENETESSAIGFSVAASHRGKGLGKLVIKLGLKAYFENNDLPVLATIKKENMASIKSFEKAGFTFFKETIINEIPSVVYQLKNKND